MTRQPGAYVLINGELQPDLNDETMAARKKLADEAAATTEKPKKSKTAEAVEVTNA